MESLHLKESQLQVLNKLNKLVSDYNNEISDDDEDAVPYIDCKYLSIEGFKKMKFNSTREFSILHLNIHSVEAHIEELRIVLQLIDFKFDFICLSESKILEGIAPKTNIKIDNYQTPLGTPTKASKGGVLIYVKEGINFEPRPDLTVGKDNELESYFIEVINERQKNSILGVIYRHPCMDENNFIDDYINPLCEKIQNEDKKVFIAGDFNFDMLKLHHTETLKFYEAMISGQLLPSILLPTKINSRNDTVIDNIFSNQTNPDIKSGNLSVTISDHLPSFFIMPKDNQIHLTKKKQVFVRDMKQFDRINFTLEYLNIDWTEKLGRYNEDADAAFQFFQWKMNNLLDKYMPWKKLSKKQFKQKYKPWINNTILNPTWAGRLSISQRLGGA